MESYMPDAASTPPPAAPAAAAPHGPTPEGAQPPGEGMVSPKLAMLMRREADAVRRMREAKTAEGSIKAREEAIAAREAKAAQIDQLWRENPMRALQERGYDYNQLTMMQLNQGQMTPEQQLRQLSQELAALKAEREQDKTTTAEQQKAAVDAELTAEETRFKSEIEEQLDAAKDKYPLTHLYKRSDLIYTHIDKHFQKTLQHSGVGEVLDFDKASQAVEAAILKEAQKAHDILQKTAAQASPQSQRPPSAFGGDTQQTWVEKPVKTLAGIQQSVPSHGPPRVLSDDDRIANALARLRAMKR